MNTIQLHIDPPLDGAHAVRVYHVRPPARLEGLDQQEYLGLLRLPPWLIQRFVQLTPIVEPLLEDCRIAWTGIALEPLPPEPMLDKVGKLMRGMKRLVKA